MIGIYCIRNLRNGKCYVGQSVNIERRFGEHKRGGQRAAILVSRALAKYGKASFAFEVLEVCPEDNLHTREAHWIIALDCVKPNGYNLTTGGEGGRHLEETRKRISESLIGNKRSVGRKFPDEHRQKISDAHKGRKLSDEHRQKISESLKGKKASAEARRKMSEASKKENLSNETRQKMSDAAKGRTPWNKGKKLKGNDRQLKLF